MVNKSISYLNVNLILCFPVSRLAYMLEKTMKSSLAAVVALSFLVSAQASDLAPPIKFRYDTTYEHGRLLKLKTPRGVARYEYDQAGKLRRKILPKGVVVDYYHDRAGRLVETRFSTGLVRTRHYDRDGKLTHIIGSDGFTLTVNGAGNARTVVVTGPNNYRADLTPLLKKARTTYASKIGTLPPQALFAPGGSADGGCSISMWGGLECDFGDGGGYDDSWGGGDSGAGADEWAGDSGAGEYGDDSGYGSDTGAGSDYGGGGNGHSEGGGYGGNDDTTDWDGMDGGAGGEQAPDPGSPGNNVYLQCMTVNCERQNQDFREFCSRELPQHQEMCYRYTAKYYFKCERECWYTSY
jgi:YD repeat-containing protein